MHHGLHEKLLQLAGHRPTFVVYGAKKKKYNQGVHSFLSGISLGGGAMVHTQIDILFRARCIRREATEYTVQSHHIIYHGEVSI